MNQAIPNMAANRLKHLLLKFVFSIPLLQAAALLAAVPIPLRTAIVADSADRRLSQLVDLVTAQLHGQPDLQLLERQEVLPILNEQNLAVSGISDDARSVAAGRLLSVDLFGILDTQSGHTALVIFDARNGLRLTDAQLAGDDVPAQAKQASDEFRLALAKRRSQTQPVCLLTVRNADMGSSMDGFCDGIGKILQRRLLMCKDVTVLERRYLDQVNKERALPTSRPSMPLLPSLQFLELEISREKEPGNYAAIVFLSDSNGNKLRSVNADAGNAGELVERLLGRIFEKFGAALAQPANPQRESARFGLESDFFRSHEQCASALAASEAAYALNPSDSMNQERLAKDLVKSATANCPLDAAVSQLHRALDLRRGNQNNGPSLRDGAYFEIEDAIGDFLGNQGASEERSRVAQELDSLRSDFRDYQIEHIRKWATSSSAHRQSAEWTANFLWGGVIPRLNATAPTRTAFAADLDEVVANQWLPVYEKETSHDWNQFPNWANLSSFIKCVFRGYERWHPWDYYNHGEPGGLSTPPQDLYDYARTMPRVYQKFAASHDPVFQFCGHAGEAWCKALASGRSLDDLQEPFQRVAADVKQMIARAAESGERERIYVAWELAIDLFFRPNDHMFDDTSIPSRQRRKELDVMWSFRKARHEFRDAEQNATPAGPLWVRADRICEIHDTPGLDDIDCMIHPVVRDGSVWVVGLGHAGIRKFMQLLRLPLIEGPVQRFARLDVDWIDDSSPPNCSRESGSALADDCYYLSSREIGILAFPRDGRAGFFINHNNGLPTDHVDSVAWLGDSLYAGLGDGGYIIRYDPKKFRCNVLASSRRKEKRSPLDDDLLWDVPCMVADPPRDRLVLMANERGKGGIWQITSTGVLSQIYQTTVEGYGAWFSELHDDHVIMATNEWILDMDLRADLPVVLHKNFFAAIGPKITPASASITPNVSLFPPYLCRDGWLWAGHDFTRTNVSSGRTEDLPEISSNTVHERIVPADVLQLFDKGRHALVGNQQKLWLLTFDTSEGPTTRP